MKPYRIYLIRLAGVVAVSLMFAGCTYTLRSKDVSVLETGSPLKSVPPKTFAFKDFIDARGTAAKESEFRSELPVYGGKGARDPYLFRQEGALKCKVDQLPASLVAMVIKKELERNGHKCITYSAQSNPDFIIEGSLYKFAYGMLVAVKLTVSPVSPGKEVLIKTYEGKGPATIIHNCKTSLNLALMAMVKEFSTDPDLVAFLEK
jgi:hypothetical protein